jgi:hypothetical protein
LRPTSPYFPDVNHYLPLSAFRLNPLSLNFLVTAAATLTAGSRATSCSTRQRIVTFSGLDAHPLFPSAVHPNLLRGCAIASHTACVLIHPHTPADVRTSLTSLLPTPSLRKLQAILNTGVDRRKLGDLIVQVRCGWPLSLSLSLSLSLFLSLSVSFHSAALMHR